MPEIFSDVADLWQHPLQHVFNVYIGVVIIITMGLAFKRSLKSQELELALFIDVLTGCAGIATGIYALYRAITLESSFASKISNLMLGSGSVPLDINAFLMYGVVAAVLGSKKLYAAFAAPKFVPKIDP